MTSPPVPAVTPARSEVVVGLRERVSSYRGLLAFGLSAFGAILTVGLFAIAVRAPQTRLGFDLHAYWAVDPFHPYAVPLGSYDAYTYSPSFALAVAPSHLLPFEAFYVLWLALLAACLVWLCGRYSLAWLAFLPIPLELYEGNVHVLLAVVCVLGLRWPALWSFALLTKVTPGVCLLWFAVRREWRPLAIALGVTAGIAAASFVVVPSAWPEWVRFLADSQSGGPGVNDKPYLALIPPLWLRLAAAALIVVWGARGDRRWVLPVAATMALPVLWITGPAILAAIPRLRHGRTAPARVTSAPSSSDA